MTTRLSSAALFAIAALIARCGSAGGRHTVSTRAANRTLAATSRGGPNPAAASPGGAAVVRLRESEFTITPANPRVTAHVVQFEVTNNGSITHSFAVRTPFGVLKSDPIAPGQKGGLTVDLIKPGIYTFYCPLGHHRLKGMQGSVVIESP
ncbi:MAG: cupredoxin domain-containing protein [Solirubrobacteraceae bacterium]